MMPFFPRRSPRSRRALLLAAFGLAFLGAVFSLRSRLHAYFFEGPRWPAGQNVVMYLQLGSTPGTLIDSFTSWGQSAEDALAIWNRYLGSGVQFTVVRDSTIPISNQDGKNSVFFSDNIFGSPFGADVLAITRYRYIGSSASVGTLTQADVVFNSAKSFNSYRGALRKNASGGTIYDFHRVALHEFGHVLGLDHPDDNGQRVTALMNANISNLDALQADDIAGVQAIYNAPAPTPTPTPAPAPASTTSPAPADFNRDGQSDVVWQNQRTGERDLWLLSSGVFQRAIHLPTVADLAWQIAGTGDFDGDGNPDLVWQNTVTGQRDLWLMRDGVLQNVFHLPNVPPAWRIAGAGDIDGDGRPDLVWQNGTTGERDVWLMLGGTLRQVVHLGVVPVQWQIAAVGDLDGDGQADLVWQNLVTGERDIWFLRNAVFSRVAHLGVVPAEWQIAGTGVFRAGVGAGLVWQNTRTGDRDFWFLSGGVFQSTARLANVPPEWSIANH